MLNECGNGLGYSPHAVRSHYAANYSGPRHLHWIMVQHSLSLSPEAALLPLDHARLFLPAIPPSPGQKLWSAAHGRGLLDNLSVYGQDKAVRGQRRFGLAQRARRARMPGKHPKQSNPTTWRLAAMNMAIRGIDFNFGKEPANTASRESAMDHREALSQVVSEARDNFTNDQLPDLRADSVMANPPFNISEWWDAKLEGDVRWKYGTPPKGNANFAWLQHMLHYLAPQGSMALLLANGSMSSGSGGEGDIRRALIEADLVECMVALPGQLFTNTQIPACIWFLTKSKAARPLRASGDSFGTFYRDRRGETLFIDARKLGFMKDRVLRDFIEEDIEKIAGAISEWRFDQPAWRGATEKRGGLLPPADEGYQDAPGFCRSATVEEIATHGFVLTPGRYVGAEGVEDDGEPFEEKMAKLVAQVEDQFAESSRLEAAIRKNLSSMGFSAKEEVSS